MSLSARYLWPSSEAISKAGVAHSDHDYLLAAHVDRVERVVVAVAVHEDPVELTGVVRDVGIPMMSVADHQDVVGANFAVRSA